MLYDPNDNLRFSTFLNNPSRATRTCEQVKHF